MQQLLSAGEGSRFQPPVIRDADAPCVQAAVEALDYLLAPPSSPDRVMAKVATLLSHYYAPDMDEAQQTAVMLDWWEDLREFPQWAIDQACDLWRRNEPDRRPNPAAIRRECERNVMHLRKLHRKLRAVWDFRLEHGGDDSPMGLAARAAEWLRERRGDEPPPDLVEAGLLAPRTVYDLTEQGAELIQAYEQRGAVWAI